MTPHNVPLPPAGLSQIYVTISPIAGGYLTIPDSAFVSPADSNAERQVPSLAFLISHPGNPAADLLPQRILFDLGLRQQSTSYLAPQQKHLETRKPYGLFPGVPETLRRAGLNPANDIDTVILSHVHYDHHGDPEEFTNAKFLVGPGTSDLLEKGLPPESGSHQHFTTNLLLALRTEELPATGSERGKKVWKPLDPFPHASDLLADGSIYIINTPGHLPGHINLLCRIREDKWVCLCGDAFHDPRLLSGEKEIGTWKGEEGKTCSIHLDRKEAEKSIERLRRLQSLGNVELIAAHDDSWANENKGKFFPDHL